MGRSTGVISTDKSLVGGVVDHSPVLGNMQLDQRDHRVNFSLTTRAKETDRCCDAGLATWDEKDNGLCLFEVDGAKDKGDGGGRIGGGRERSEGGCCRES